MYPDRLLRKLSTTQHIETYCKFKSHYSDGGLMVTSYILGLFGTSVSVSVVVNSGEVVVSLHCGEVVYDCIILVTTTFLLFVCV